MNPQTDSAFSDNALAASALTPEAHPGETAFRNEVALMSERLLRVTSGRLAAHLAKAIAIDEAPILVWVLR